MNVVQVGDKDGVSDMTCLELLLTRIHHGRSLISVRLRYT